MPLQLSADPAQSCQVFHTPSVDVINTHAVTYDVNFFGNLRCATDAER
ncbi:MAG: hypothetical protein NTX67_06175 [Burkholderiales bacterium]|nr:hypothetical protein [Burkholderiales bacterium]